MANVNDDILHSDEALDVLRYELETFVCDGQYEHGLQLILENFLKNIHQVEQPAVWVSGFFGSGKSHLVKMLRALWINTTFSDGATAQGLADLPETIKDLLKELGTEGKRNGGLHAASGTLGAGTSGSVRLALLQIIFRSAELPEQYHIAKFILWMKKQGIFDEVKSLVIADGKDWEEELDSFYFAESLHKALVKVKPSLFASTNACVDSLTNQYPFVSDITSEDMVKSIREALTVDGKFPLTLVVLDEVQQYIGEDISRSMAVQEVVEDCSKKFNGKLMVVSTGQTAVTGTANLKKLEGRFTVRVELSDSDVDEVVRKVVLAKKADKIDSIQDLMQRNLGEISRHLKGTSLHHSPQDVYDFPKDYPILPVRRRFWETALRVLDQTGTDSQLRNQLAMIHRVVRETADNELGYMVPADYLYFNTAMKLLSSKMLSRRYYDFTMQWYQGSSDERLMARACALVFLINKIIDRNKEVGIKATVDTIADLMIDNLSEGSASLRSRLPAILDTCPLLMKIGDEYRMQTEESTAWNDEFGNQRTNIQSQTSFISAERVDRLKKGVSEQLKKIQVLQGDTKVKRDIALHFESSHPTGEYKQITVWVRDGWNTVENTVEMEARQAGNESSTIFVFLPKKSPDDLRNAIIEYKAATATLERRGIPTTSEGQDAYSAMQTTQKYAEGKINSILEESMASARVFQAGGNEIIGSSLLDMVREAIGYSLKRMYRYFDLADNDKWAKVFDRAKNGSADALQLVGHAGAVDTNPVCKEIINFLGSGKRGIDIRSQFLDSPYGWPQDAIDGALLVLMSSGFIRAETANGKVVLIQELERKAIGQLSFRVESIVLTTEQKLAIRKLMSKLEIQATQANLIEYANTFLVKLEALANTAGGEAPKPECPDTKFIHELRKMGGNELLFSIFNQEETIKKSIEDWTRVSQAIQKAWPKWLQLKQLAELAKPIAEDDVLLGQVKMIEQKRQLLLEPDMVEPLLKSLSQLLRDALNSLEKAWDAAWEEGEDCLVADNSWNRLEPEQKHELRTSKQLLEKAKPAFKVGDSTSILKTLETVGLEGLNDRIAAMPSRYQQLRLEAAKMMEPKAQVVDLKKPTLHSEQELESWLEETRLQLTAALNKGPVVVR